MRRFIIRLAAATCLLTVGVGAAEAAVCVSIDEARDTLSPQDRAAASILVSKQFEQAGEQVVPVGCPTQYSLSHVRLGDTIVVTLTGPSGSREATAAGLDDLPALYNQMVRSILTRRPMTGFNVVDRTNVTETQAGARRIHTDSIWYARLGYSGLFGDRSYGMPALGFGYRAELDPFAIDVSFLNMQFSPSDGYYSGVDSSASTFLKLSGLYFLNPTANRTPYVGGGLGWGRRSFGTPDYRSFDHYRSEWIGTGLQGELTAGYEFARATSLRMFVQGDVVLPFYQVSSQTFSRLGPTGSVDRRYAPSLVVSIGLGR
jgi:hypothetical protein